MSRFLRPSLVACAAVLVVFAGCDDPVPDKAGPTPDTGTVQDTTLLDAPGGDTPVGDAPVGDSEALEVTADAQTDGPDQGPETTLNPCPGAFGCACQADGECKDGGVCVASAVTVGQKVCHASCATAGCPLGETCVAADGKKACYPTGQAGALTCLPCKTSGDCQPDSTSAACVSLGDVGSFCTPACSQDTDCFQGATCQDVTDVDGKTSKRCKPVQCDCSPLAVALKASTVCSVTNAAGSCKGTLTCGTGTAACDAPTPATETCNGLDDDCDGTTDQGVLCDDAKPCTTDTCGGKAGCAHADSTAPCSDGNACTTGDTCAVGLCAAGTAVACDDNNPCTIDACDPASGCTATADDKATCSDGDACTTEACAGGKCATQPVVCDDGNPCTDDACDIAKGCTHVVDDSNPCSDGNACSADSCVGGACKAGSATCDDGNACTSDTCDAAKGCANLPLAATACDDGNACTTDSCDPKTGCKSEDIANCALPLPYKQPFDCGNKAWKLDAPLGGNLGWAVDASPNPPGAHSPACALNYNDGTNFVCPVGVSPLPLRFATSPWLDASKLATKAPLKVRFWLAGDWENGQWDNFVVEVSTDGTTWKPVADLDPPGDKYAAKMYDLSAYAGSKVKIRIGFGAVDCTNNGGSGPFVDDLEVFDASCTKDGDCNDGNPCTDDFCDLTAGVCAAKNNTVPCDDGNVCTSPDACKDGACGGAANTAPCDDNNACTSGDACAGSKCAGKAKSCDDSNPCTVDSCDTATGVCSSVLAKDSANCSDGDSCTTGDTCYAGKCISKVKCDDGNPCTADSCSAGTCKYTAITEGDACDDGSPCTAQDVCKAGKCVGVATACGTLVEDAFACDTKGWTFAGLPGTPTPVAWALDDQPYPPGFKSGNCSLNFNNDKNFLCNPTDKKVAGTATSQVYDLTNVKSATLQVWSYADVSGGDTTDFRWIEVSADDFQTVALKHWVDNDSAVNKKWLPVAVDLKAVVGKKVKVRFHFDSGDCITNSGAGWFVDDLKIVTDVAPACKADADCDDKSPCTDHKCLDSKCVPTFTTAACDDGLACTDKDTCNGLGVCIGGPALSCNDNNACTTDSCDTVKGCQNVVREDGQVCSDGNSCTGYNTGTTSDVCVNAQCKGVTKCDDFNPCTTDSCSTSGTCTFKPVTDGAACSDDDACTASDKCTAGKCAGAPTPCSVVADQPFACKGGETWVIAPAASDVTPAFAVDSTPNPPAFHGPDCSLNFNNGKDFACAPGATKASGTATSPVYDLSQAKAASLQFWSWSDHATDFATDVRTVEASTDDFQTVAWSKTLPNSTTVQKKWTFVKYDVGALAGKKVKLRFHFDSVNCTANSGAGWFVDEVKLLADVAQSCQTDANCGDGDPCTDDTCKGGKCEHVGNTGNACEDGNACTEADKCVAGLCTNVKAKVCNDTNDCTTDTCNVETGCEFTVTKKDGEACSDGSACTTADSCSAGKCVGGPAAQDGLGCSDNNTCTTADKCTAGKCAGTGLAPDGLFCNDGDPCTSLDGCKAGKCVGAAPACDDGNSCTADSCVNDFGTKVCKNVQLPEGATCTDGDVCTTDDACAAGKCVAKPTGCLTAGLEPFDCGKVSGWVLDPVDATGTGWAVDGTPEPPGYLSPSCSLNFNNGKDFDSGAQVKGSAVSPPIEVPADGQLEVHVSTWFDSESGSYDKKFVEISTDDFKTVAVSAEPLAKATPKQWAKLKISLVSFAGKTVKIRFRFDSLDAFGNAGAGWFLDDFTLLVPKLGAACKTDVDCSDEDGNPCTLETCVGAYCKPAPAKDGTACDDGNPCTANTACALNLCKGGTPTVCDDGNSCTADSCDPKVGCVSAKIQGCDSAALPFEEKFTCGSPSLDKWTFENAPYKDAAIWNVDATPEVPGYFSATCSLNFNNGKDFACTAEQKAAPSDSDGVSGGALSPLLDATKVAKGAFLVAKFQYGGDWENGSYDNLQVDVVGEDGKVVQAKAADLDDFSTFGWKSVLIDLSAHAGTKFRLRFLFFSTDCGGNSTVGAFVDDLMVYDGTCKDDAGCADGNACTADKCDVATGKCSYSNTTGTCDDGLGCTEKDACSAGTCKGVAKACNDSNDCTSDACDVKTGQCAFTVKADASSCSDGNTCTTGDACVAGKCVAKGNANDGTTCSDSNTCTTGDSCLAGKCTPKANATDGGSCSDSNPCTMVDKCKTGVCTGLPACEDGSPCTVEECEKIDSFTKKCTTTQTSSDGTACDDGNACTSGEKCSSGLCVPAAQTCSAVFSESFDKCDQTTGWTFDAKVDGKVGWGIDATPSNPAAFSPTCSLNFNDGTTYGIANKTTAGKATSPPIALPAGASAITLHFWSFSGVKETYEDRVVEVISGTNILQSFKLLTEFPAADPVNLNKWTSITLDLKAHAGKTVQLRFAFNTKDSYVNEGPGWFVDNVTIQASVPSAAKEWKVTTPGFAFEPADLSIAAGDKVTFEIGAMHTATEVDQATWDANGNTPKSGGFKVGFGETKTVTFPTAGTYYYVCEPHAGGGMKGKITVK